MAYYSSVQQCWPVSHFIKLEKWVKGFKNVRVYNDGNSFNNNEDKMKIPQPLLANVAGVEDEAVVKPVALNLKLTHYMYRNIDWNISLSFLTKDATS